MTHRKTQFMKYSIMSLLFLSTALPESAYGETSLEDGAQVNSDEIQRNNSLKLLETMRILKPDVFKDVGDGQQDSDKEDNLKHQASGGKSSIYHNINKTENYRKYDIRRQEQYISDANQNCIKREDEELDTGAPLRYTVRIDSRKPWINTGIFLEKNDTVLIKAAGKVMPGNFEKFLEHTSCTTAGYSFARRESFLPNAPYMSLIGRIGKGAPFFVGDNAAFTTGENGRLYFTVNELTRSAYTGTPINKRSIYWHDNTGFYEADACVYRK